MKSFRLGVLVLAGLASVIVALAGGFAYATNYLPQRLFDSAEWKAHPGSFDSTYRLSMVDSLLWLHDLKGMTREQVTALLGPPPANGGGYFSEWDLVYPLGPERGLFSIDTEWLVIRVEPGKRVTEYKLVTD